LSTVISYPVCPSLYCNLADLFKESNFLSTACNQAKEAIDRTCF